MTKDELIDIKSLALKSVFEPSGYITPGGEELMMVSGQKVMVLYQELVHKGIIKKGEELPGNIALIPMLHHNAYFLLFKKPN